MKARHGLIIGKFYPPHAGHHLLVRTASAVCERVTVEVLASSVESLGLESRVAWMREVHSVDRNVTIVGAMDDHPIDYGDPLVWEAHVSIMREAVARVTDEPVDVVFTSEGYGDELARRLGARHVCLDVARGLVPISATAIRRDPVAHWELLAPPTRAALTLRVSLVGAESTGKTTLARELAEALCARGGSWMRTRWVPEFGRAYALDKLARARATAALDGRSPTRPEELRWESPEFATIARGQIALEHEAAREGGPVLVADTDALATSIWHERYMGSVSAELQALAEANRPALTLLTHPDDVAFEQDGTRDGEAIRHWMHDRFVQALEESGRRFELVRGGRQQRREQALDAVRRLVARGWGLADPLG